MDGGDVDQGNRESGVGRAALDRSAGFLVMVIGSILAALGLLFLLEPSAISGTIVALPLAVAIFSAFERLAAGDSRHAPDHPSPLLSSAPLLLLFWGLLSPRSGLLLAEPLFGVGFFLYLAARLYRLLPALRRALGRQLPAHPSPIFYLLPAASALLLLPWHLSHHQPDGDEPWYLLLTHSLAYDQDVDLSNNYDQGDWRNFMEREISPQVGDPVGGDGELYSRHNRWFPLLLTVPYRLGGRALATATLTLLAATLPWLFLRVLYLIGLPSSRGAFLAWLTLAFAPPLLSYAHQLWVEAPAALLFLLAIERTLVLARASDPPGRENRGLAAAVMLTCLAAVVLLKLRFLLVAAPLAVLALILLIRRSRERNAGTKRTLAIQAIVTSVLGVGFVAAILFNNQARFGSAFKTLDPIASIPTMADLPMVAIRVVGLWFDVGFGLMWAAPVWILALPGFLILLRRRKGLLAAGLGLATPSLLAIGARSEWYGGWSPAFRYGVVLLPLLAIVLAFALEELPRSTRGRALAQLLSAGTLCSALILWLSPGLGYNLADGRSHLVSALERLTGAQLAQLFPSAARPNLALFVWTLATVLVLSATFTRHPRNRRPGPDRWSPASRLALVLLAGAGTLGLAVTLPAPPVQFESEAVAKTAGQREPARWLHDRTRFRESWVLPEGAAASTIVKGQGEALMLDLRARTIQNHGATIEVELLADDQVLGRHVLFPPEAWQTLTLGPLSWPAGARRLSLRVVPGALMEAPPNGVVVDEMTLRWQ